MRSCHKNTWIENVQPGDVNIYECENVFCGFYAVEFIPKLASENIEKYNFRFCQNELLECSGSG